MFFFVMQELGVLNNPNYKICFLLDSGAMITVLSSKYGLIEVCCSAKCQLIKSEMMADCYLFLTY